MPKIKCKCENILWLGDIPCSHSYLYISEIALEDLESSNAQHNEIIHKMDYFVKCNVCLRLHFLKNDNTLDTYLKE